MFIFIIAFSFFSLFATAMITYKRNAPVPKSGEVMAEWDQISRFVWLKWVGYSGGDQYRYGFSKTLDLIDKHSAQKMLLDLSDIKVVSPEDQEWTSHFFIQKLQKYAIRKVALVKPRDMLAKASLKLIYKDIKNEISCEKGVFEEVEEAVEWLKEEK